MYKVRMDDMWDKSCNCNEIETYIDGRRAWKFIKAVRKDSKGLGIQNITLTKWEGYNSKKLLTEHRQQFIGKSNFINIEEEEIRLELEKVIKIMKSLKNRKALRPGIPVELIKNGTQKLFIIIIEMMNKCPSSS